jgi:folate-dependent phosphoribosylglycinamide formyltransferase PurN
VENVVLFSPNRHSLYTICVAELLRRGGVNIAAIVTRRLLNPKRFAKEFARDGVRLLRKIWIKLVLRQRTFHKTNYPTLVDFMAAEKITQRTVDDFRREHGIPVVYCDDLNDAVVVDTLERTRPRVVVFTGGGLIRGEVLRRAGDGVLNCHMGILPDYRGMDVVEWPLLEGKPDCVGLTVHFMDAGVDTGDILATHRVEPCAGENVHDLRGRFEVPMCRELVAACEGWLAGRLTRRPQAGEKTRQYFILHPRLMELARARLSSSS